MTGFGMKDRFSFYGFHDTLCIGGKVSVPIPGMDGKADGYGLISIPHPFSCWVECHLKSVDGYGYGFALWSPYGFSNGQTIRNGRNIPMMREVTRGCTVRFTVTPTMNGEEMPIDEGRIEFIIRGADGVSVTASSENGEIELTPEQMAIPVGKYSWAVRWVRSESVHMLGTGRLDVTKNIFMED